MKSIFLIIFICLFGLNTYGQRLNIDDFKLVESLPDWITFKIDEIKTEKDLLLDKEMNPFYLETDFNGDDKLDIAFCVKDKLTNKKGILIIHGGDFKTYLIGAGNNFAHVGDDFRFVELWKIYRERVVELTEFAENGDILGNKEIKIENDAIVVSKSESASNLIAWQNDKYVWLHTGD
ncbi:hypothetical protein [Draconibacterium sediminis]|uniref:hypothetical protein n=1 Tax=Draconibacterium sediminis TaxID=1544798 RepID=UPI0026F0157E|nr:hypothetical protein [Draconibacterium sediminis]